MVIVFNIFLFLLAAYGAAALFFAIIGAIRQRMADENSNVSLVLLIKNKEDVIEGIVRNIFISDFPGKLLAGGKLTILDMGSTDGTRSILERLKREFDTIEILNEEEKSSIFLSFNSSSGKMIR